MKKYDPSIPNYPKLVAAFRSQLSRDQLDTLEDQLKGVRITLDSLGQHPETSVDVFLKDIDNLLLQIADTRAAWDDPD